jgi:hypothetical protein
MATSSTLTQIVSFHYTDAKRSVDPIGEDFFNTLLDLASAADLAAHLDACCGSVQSPKLGEDCNNHPVVGIYRSHGVKANLEEWHHEKQKTPQ